MYPQGIETSDGDWAVAIDGTVFLLTELGEAECFMVQAQMVLVGDIDQGGVYGSDPRRLPPRGQVSRWRPGSVERRLVELHERTSIAPLGAVVARRSSTRFLFVVPAEGHRSALARALVAYERKWSAHVDWRPYV